MSCFSTYSLSFDNPASLSAGPPSASQGLAVSNICCWATGLPVFLVDRHSRDISAREPRCLCRFTKAAQALGRVKLEGMGVPATLALQLALADCLTEIKQHASFTRQDGLAFMRLLEGVVDFAGQTHKNTEDLLRQMLRHFAQCKGLAVTSDGPGHLLKAADSAVESGPGNVSAVTSDVPDGQLKAADSAVAIGPEGEAGQLVQAPPSCAGSNKGPLLLSPEDANALARNIHMAWKWFSTVALHKLLTKEHLDLCEQNKLDVSKLAGDFKDLSTQAQSASEIAAGLVAMAGGTHEAGGASLPERVDLHARVSSMLSGSSGWLFTEKEDFDAAMLHFEQAFDLAEYVRPVLDGKTSDLQAQLAVLWYD